nr:Potassium efflux system KefA precursor [Klebsiella pneumoniae]
MKITVNWEKRGLRCLSLSGRFTAAVDCRPHPLASAVAQGLSGKACFPVGQLRNDTQLHTPKAILIDLIRALPVVLLILAIGLILLTMQLNISGLLWAYSKSWLCSGWCLACAGKCWKRTASRSTTLICRRS